MKLVTLGGIVATISLLSAAEARPPCHLYSRWHYPWPQRCGVHHHPPASTSLHQLAPTEKVGNSIPNQEHSLNIPLPALTPVTWGPWADDEIQARIKLRLELER